VSSKGVLHSSDFHSLDQLSFHDLSGHHSWLNAVRSELKSCLLHYQDFKRRPPSTTSACILVPRRRHGSVVTLLHRWTVVMEIPTGQLIHVWKDGKLQQEKSRYAMQVLYDPVRSEQLHHVYQDGRVTMQFVGKAAGTKVDFLFDSGASTNYVSSAFAKMHGLTVKPSETNVRLGTETSVSAQGECAMHIKLGDYQDRVECYILDMGTNFQMILGDTWLNMVKATFDYDSKKCIIRKNNKRFTLSSSTRSMLRHKLSSRGNKEPPILSAMQVNERLRGAIK
jgi:predicted aspartyl protease